jgi:chromosome segregation ATPase
LLLALSSASCFAQEVGDMPTEDIISELIAINERQQERLSELERLLLEQQATLNSLQSNLSEAQTSLETLRQTVQELTNYSRSLESEVSRLETLRSRLLWAVGISTVAAVVGWIL